MRLWEQYLFAALTLGSLAIIIAQLEKIQRLLERKP